MKIFRFIKKAFFTGLTILSSFTNPIPLSTALLNTTRLNAIPLSCISMSDQEFKAKPEIVNVSSNNPIFYPFSVKTSKGSVIVTTLMIHMQESVFLML